MPRLTWLSLLIVVISTFASNYSRVYADKSLAGRACRSVHLGYPAPVGEAFYCEVKVEESAPGSYFMVCGWNTGYFGIQEISKGKKVVLFSVWDNHKGDDPNAVKKDVRVGILHEGKDVNVARFGGEGTGGKSMFAFDWKRGETYRCLVTSKAKGERTEYSGYFYLPADKKWKHLVTFSTITGGKHLSGYYSFVEDFRRNGESAKQARRAQFGNVWVKPVGKDWVAGTRARFTGDSNPATNIDAGASGAMFYLATGGETKNSGPQLRSFIDLGEDDIPTQLPKDLP